MNCAFPLRKTWWSCDYPDVFNNTKNLSFLAIYQKVIYVIIAWLVYDAILYYIILYYVINGENSAFTNRQRTPQIIFL